VYIGYASPNFQQRHILKDWDLHEDRCADFKCRLWLLIILKCNVENIR